jgi:hypothetical protein
MLVVEAKTSLPDLTQTEEQLSHYMIGMRCPMGILTTPERMRVYRDLYTSPPTIERIADFDTRGVWQQQRPQDAASFERFVHQWLERLAQMPTKDLPRNVAETFREYVVPAVIGGDVRAAHPRYS